MGRINIKTGVTVVNEGGEHPPGSVISIDEAEGLSLIERFGGEVVKTKSKGKTKNDSQGQDDDNDNDGGDAST